MSNAKCVLYGMVDDNGSGLCERLLNDGWDYHDKESERLAGELEAVAQAGIAPAFLAPFLNLSAHTIGEHLADWPDSGEGDRHTE